MKSVKTTFGSLPRVSRWLVLALFVGAVGTALYAQPGGAPKPGAAPVAKAPAKAPATKPAAEERMSLWELLVKGGWIMIPIGVCSLIGLAVIIERVASLRHSKIVPPGFMDGLKKVFLNARADRAAGLDYCAKNDSPLARLVAVGIRKLHKGEEIVERAIEEAGAGEVARLSRNLRMMYAVAAVAPMLGLLGTVWGMIEAFQVAAKMGFGGQGKDMAKGIYEAMVTTFGGLVVAIPLLMLYHYFIGRIENLVNEMNDISVEFIEHYLSEEAAKAPRPAPQTV